MNVGLDDDRRSLQDSARSVLAAESPPAVTREAYDDPTRWQSLWKTLVGLGWPAAGVPDADGADDALDLVVLLEQAGAATLPAPLLSTAGLAAGALRGCGAEVSGVVEDLAGGAVGALAIDRIPPADDQLPRLAGGRLVGHVAQVRDAERADILVAVARDEDDNDRVAVVRNGPGVTVTPAGSLDPSAPVAAVDFDVDVDVHSAVQRESALAVPLTAAAAELVGVADRALAMSVAHAKTREQFGQPIGAFQGVKHRLADCYVALERARSLTYYAAASCTRDALGDTATWRAALLAKAAAGDAAAQATRSAVAVHGAIAQTWEHDAHLLLRRAWLGSALFGDSRSLYVAAGRDYVAASR